MSHKSDVGDEAVAALISALVAAAIEKGIPIAVELAESLAGAIVALLGNIGRLQLAGDPLSVATRIVAGIDRDHPEWNGEQKRRWARDAIIWHMAHLPQLGPGGSETTANALLELAVQRVKAG